MSVSWQRRTERSSNYLGKLRGNSNSTEYVLYDGGLSPHELAGGDSDSDNERRGSPGKVRESQVDPLLPPLGVDV
jgi:hypothetical protein